MSTVRVQQTVPAMDPGTKKDGTSVYCGLSEENVSLGTFTNSFSFQVEEKKS